MAQTISQEQQTALRRLLERAKQAIPFIRLDKADEVTSSFESTIALLNRSLVPGGPRSSSGSTGGPSSEFYREDNEDSGIDLFSVEPLSNDFPTPEPSPRDGPPAPYVKPLNKRVVGMREVRRDFSSPSLKKRQLRPPGQGSLSASAPTSPAFGSNPLKSSSHLSSRAPSSRATKSVSSSNLPQSSSGLGLGLGKSSGGADESSKKAAYLKKLNLASSRPVTRDTDSPKLGSRGLGGRSALPGKVPAPAPASSSGAAGSSSRAKDPARSELVVRVTKDSGLLEAPHSPMQLNAHRRLLALGASREDRGPSPTKEAVFPAKVVQKIPGSPSSFLRPLNHPSTRGAELITAKVQLKKIVAAGEGLIPQIRADSFDEVYEQLLKSVELLEASTTTAKKQPPGYAP